MGLHRCRRTARPCIGWSGWLCPRMRLRFGCVCCKHHVRVVFKCLRAFTRLPRHRRRGVCQLQGSMMVSITRPRSARGVSARSFSKYDTESWPTTVSRVLTPWGPLALHFDAKTSPVVAWSPSNGWKALAPNALPMPAGPLELGGSCPGATPSCVSCYAVRGLEFRPSFARLVAQNLETLLSADAAGGKEAMAAAIVAAMDLSVARQHRCMVDTPTFRFHSDGDVFSLAHAQAVAAAACRRPSVPSWIYTRTLDAVPHLRGVESLRVYVSVDVHNVEAAVPVLRRFPDVLPALLVDGNDERAALLDVLGLSNVPSCPATSAWTRDGRGPSFVAGAHGDRRGLGSPSSGDRAKGACDACRLCLPGGATRPVLFDVHGGRGTLEAATRVLLRRQGQLGQDLPAAA